MNLPEPIVRIFTIASLLSPFILVIFGFDLQPIIDWIQAGTVEGVAFVGYVVGLITQVVAYIRDWRRALKAGVSSAEYHLMSPRAISAVYGSPN